MVVNIRVNHLDVDTPSWYIRKRLLSTQLLGKSKHGSLGAGLPVKAGMRGCCRVLFSDFQRWLMKHGVRQAVTLTRKAMCEGRLSCLRLGLGYGSKTGNLGTQEVTLDSTYFLTYSTL